MKKIKDKIVKFFDKYIVEIVVCVVIIISITLLIGLDYLIAESDLPEWIKFRWFSK